MSKEQLQSLIQECITYGAVVARQLDADRRTAAAEAAEEPNNIALPGHPHSGSSLWGSSSSSPKPKPPLLLHPHQIEGVQWLLAMFKNNVNGILADEMGLGKTVTVLSFLSALFRSNYYGTHLVVVPLSTLENWKSECAVWCPWVPLVVFHGPKATRASLRDWIRRRYRSSWSRQKEILQRCSRGEPPESLVKDVGGIVVTSFEMAMCDGAALCRAIPWDMLIVDEAHRIKNVNCKLLDCLRTKVRCEGRLLLTGTPLQNNIRELWSIMNFIMPHLFRDADVFTAWLDRADHATLQDEQSDRDGGDVDEFKDDHRGPQNRSSDCVSTAVDAELQGVESSSAGNPSAVLDESTRRAEAWRASIERLRSVAAHSTGRGGVAENSTSAAAPPEGTEGGKSGRRPVQPVLSSRAVGSSALSLSAPSSKPATHSLPTLSSHFVTSSDVKGVVGWVHPDRNDAAETAAAPLSLADMTAAVSGIHTALRPFVLRRLKRDIPELQLPLKCELFLWAELPVSQQRIYEEVKASSRYSNNRLMHLRKVCCHPFLFPEFSPTMGGQAKKNETNPSSSLQLQQLLQASAKFSLLDAVLRGLLQRHADRKHKILIFSQMTRVLDLIEEYLELVSSSEGENVAANGSLRSAPNPPRPEYRYVRLDGSCTREERIESIRLFNESTDKSRKKQERATKFEPHDHDDNSVFVRAKPAATKRSRPGDDDNKDESDDDAADNSAQTTTLPSDHHHQPSIFLLSTRSGGVGLNLVAADTVILFDGDFNPHNDQQAIDRCHRIGQTRPVVVYRMVCPGTVEEALLRIAERKKHLEHAVLECGRFHLPSVKSGRLHRSTLHDDETEKSDKHLLDATGSANNQRVVDVRESLRRFVFASSSKSSVTSGQSSFRIATPVGALLPSASFPGGGAVTSTTNHSAPTAPHIKERVNEEDDDDDGRADSTVGLESLTMKLTFSHVSSAQRVSSSELDDLLDRTVVLSLCDGGGDDGERASR